MNVLKEGLDTIRISIFFLLKVELIVRLIEILGLTEFKGQRMIRYGFRYITFGNRLNFSIIAFLLLMKNKLKSLKTHK